MYIVHEGDKYSRNNSMLSANEWDIFDNLHVSVRVLLPLVVIVVVVVFVAFFKWKM